MGVFVGGLAANVLIGVFCGLLGIFLARAACLWYCYDIIERDSDSDNLAGQTQRALQEIKALMPVVKYEEAQEQSPWCSPVAAAEAAAVLCGCDCDDEANSNSPTSSCHLANAHIPVVQPDKMLAPPESAVVRVVSGDSSETPTSCSVCLEEFRLTDDVMVLPCYHVFHDVCALTWFSEKSVPTCPLCLQAVLSHPRVPVQGPQLEILVL